MIRALVLAGAVLCAWLPGARAADPPAAPAPEAPATTPEAPRPIDLSTGRGVYDAFRDGLADPGCDAGATARWRAHFGHVPRQLSRHPDNDVLPLFAYVVGQLRAAHLPTEFALVPFVESGYRPGARSASGPAGLWQFIGITARNHGIAIRGGYDGRLSPVDSTTAAVRYLKTLHGMFAGDWRLATMAFNAGEYRVLGALKRHGQRAHDADPAALTSLSPITQAYVRKLHAVACLLVEAGHDPEWIATLERPVPVLAARTLAPSDGTLDGWAWRNGHDPALLRRLNPAYPEGRLAATGIALRVLAVDHAASRPPPLLALPDPPPPAPAPAAASDPGGAAPADPMAH